MPPAPLVAGPVVFALVALHLAADRRGARAARAATKVLASLAFVALALALGVDGRFDALVLAGLLLSVVGDALLLAGRKGVFLAGLVAFLLAHVAYAAAFAGPSRPGAAAALGIAVVTGAALRWLWPHLGDLRAAVIAYCVVISVMLWLALGVDRPEVRLGAALFYASDLFVARDRFAAPGRVNRVVGLPLYYAGQLLIAASVG